MKKRTSPKALLSVLLTKHYLGDQNKKNETDEACVSCGGEEKCVQSLGARPDGKKLFGRPKHRQDVMWKCIVKKRNWGGGMDCNKLVQDRDRWRTFVNAVKSTFGLHKMRGNS